MNLNTISLPTKARPTNPKKERKKEMKSNIVLMPSSSSQKFWQNMGLQSIAFCPYIVCSLLLFHKKESLAWMT
jgi:hypothetical protein